MKKFIEFLERNNARENFERALVESRRDIEGYKEFCKEYCKKYKNSELSAAFTWEKTKEGHKYWAKLNWKWREENTPLSE
jgi:hypothetical protein